MRSLNLEIAHIFCILLQIYFLFGKIKCEIPVVVNTWNFDEATNAAWGELSSNGNPIDAVVAGCSFCEFNPTLCDTTVGWGYSPDENGETTLDAMVMDGSNRDMGSVAGLRGIKNAIGVANAVKKYTKHSMLVGSLATDFAVLMGFPLENLTSENSQEQWENWLANDCQPNNWQNVEPNPEESCGPYTPEDTGNHIEQKYNEDYINEYNHDTIGMVAIDETGNIAIGTSTNGIRFKIPGRVGDTAIVGAGGYADNDVGAAVATGDGDILIRFLPCLKAVEYMKQGDDPSEAATRAIEEILQFYPSAGGGIVAVNNDGDIGAACSLGGFTYSYRTANMTEAEIVSVECI